MDIVEMIGRDDERTRVIQYGGKFSKTLFDTGYLGSQMAMGVDAFIQSIKNGDHEHMDYDDTLKEMSDVTEAEEGCVTGPDCCDEPDRRDPEPARVTARARVSAGPFRLHSAVGELREYLERPDRLSSSLRVERCDRGWFVQLHVGDREGTYHQAVSEVLSEAIELCVIAERVCTKTGGS